MKINGKEYKIVEDCETVSETDNAVLILIDNEEKWIPKSQLEDWPDKGEEGEIIITKWWGEKEGIC